MYFMYGLIKILEYSTQMNRLRRETCTLPEHNLPSRERERQKKTFLEQAAFWHEVKVEQAYHPNIDVGNYNHEELTRLLQPVAQINAQFIMELY